MHPCLTHRGEPRSRPRTPTLPACCTQAPTKPKLPTRATSGFHLVTWLQATCRTSADVANTYAKALAADGFDSLEALTTLVEPPSLIQPGHLNLLRPFLATPPPRPDKRIMQELQETLGGCPITQEPFKVPVMAPDGFIYERAAIRTWLLRKSTSPMTNLPMKKRFANSTLLYNVVRAVHMATDAP